MDRRYNILETEGVRDIDLDHSTVVEPARKKRVDEMPETMPYIVIVIDELADIMSSYPRELEASYRPSRTNVPRGGYSPYPFHAAPFGKRHHWAHQSKRTNAPRAASSFANRLAYDFGRLRCRDPLGAGDMLYLSSDMQKPVRLQTAYITENEVKKVASYIKTHNAGDLSSIDMGGGGIVSTDMGDTIGLAQMSEDDEIDDDLYSEAKVAVEEAGDAPQLRTSSAS